MNIFNIPLLPLQLMYNFTLQLTHIVVFPGATDPSGKVLLDASEMELNWVI